MLNPEIYKAAVPTITTEHVIITDKQLEHIRERHPDISATVMEQLTEIIHAPDYIIETDMPYTQPSILSGWFNSLLSRPVRYNSYRRSVFVVISTAPCFCINSKII